jgi:hypothetical protein
MIGVDENLDWGGLIARRGLNTDISLDGSVQDLCSLTIPHIEKGMTDITQPTKII